MDHPGLIHLFEWCRPLLGAFRLDYYTNEEWDPGGFGPKDPESDDLSAASDRGLGNVW